MKQYTLDEMAKHLARRGDPETSKLGAKDAASRLGKLQAFTLSAVTRHPGLTSSELTKKLALSDPRQINRRLPELEREGLIIRADARPCSVTKRKAHTWRPA